MSGSTDAESKLTQPLWLYEQHGNTFVPSELAGGPWASGTQNGGALAALLGAVLEQTPSRTRMIPMDLHVEILKPIPFQELVIERRVPRDGQRLQIVHASVLAGRETIALATLVRLRIASGPASESSRQPLRRAPPDDLPVLENEFPIFKFMECRAFGHPFDEVGPGAAWFRMRGQIIAGQASSPLGAAMLAADAGSGLGAAVTRPEWAYPNVTLALHAHRASRGEWLLLESEMVTDGNGVAHVTGAFSDLCGPFGSTHQAIILERVQAR